MNLISNDLFEYLLSFMAFLYKFIKFFYNHINLTYKLNKDNIIVLSL